jgi:hypothetical protein
MLKILLKKIFVRIITFQTKVILNTYTLYIIFRNPIDFTKFHDLDINKFKNTSIEMQPYQAYDCILQYLYLAVNLAKLGMNVSLRLPTSKSFLFPFNLFFLSKIFTIRISQTFSVETYLSILESKNLDKFIVNTPRTFSEQVEFIIRTLNKNKNLALSAVDSFVRTCKFKQFFDKDTLDDTFIQNLFAAKRCLDEDGHNLNFDNYDHIFMPDSAYLSNSIYKYFNETNGAKISILHPYGNYFSLYKGESDYQVSDKLLNEILGRRSRTEITQSEYYKKLRMSGKSADLDSRVAYSDLKIHHSSHDFRKVLFLHAVRDANNLYPVQPSEPNLFNTYFEWMNFMISAISEGNPERWYIKIHPMSSLYENDRQIVENILSRYGLENKLNEFIPSTKSIIEAKMPVFTHSGTIALETASIGYKSIVVGSRYSDKLVKKVKTHEELYNLTVKDSEENCVEVLPEEISEAATIILHNHFGKLNASSISPNRAVYPSTDSLSFAVSNFTSTLSLIANLNKKEALESVSYIVSKSILEN